MLTKSLALLRKSLADYNIPIHFSQLVTKAQAKDIIKWFHDNCKWHSAKTYKTVAGTGEEDLDTRKGQVMFARTNPPHTKLMVDLIHHVAVKYNIAIKEGEIDWQFVKYDVGDFFGNHRDSYPTVFGMNDELGVRKLSLTVQLSEESDYEGGELRLENDTSGAYHLNKEIGQGVVFPSWIRHEIKPITKGTRYALVAWQRGPFWS